MPHRYMMKAANEAASPDPAPGAGGDMSASTTIVRIDVDFGATLPIKLDLTTDVAQPSFALTFMQTLEIFCGDADGTG